MKLDELSGVSSKSLLNTVEFIGHMFSLFCGTLITPMNTDEKSSKEKYLSSMFVSLDDIFPIKVGARNTTPPRSMVLSFTLGPSLQWSS